MLSEVNFHVGASIVVLTAPFVRTAEPVFVLMCFQVIPQNPPMFKLFFAPRVRAYIILLNVLGLVRSHMVIQMLSHLKHLVAALYVALKVSCGQMCVQMLLHLTWFLKNFLTLVKHAFNIIKLQFLDKNSKFIIFCNFLTGIVFVLFIVSYFLIVILALLILWHFQLDLVFIGFITTVRLVEI